jgi:hypothetical protein
MHLATAYWESQVFLTAHRLRLFEALAAAPRTVPETAAALGTHPRPTRLLLKACVALGLVEEAAGHFCNSPLSQAFLVPGSPTYIGNTVRYSDDLYPIWGQLERALRENQPPLLPMAYLGDDPQRTRHFVYGMHDRALGIGSALVNLVDLTGRRHVLDVGGGPGTYAALLTRRYPTLHAQVLDLPEVVALAGEILTHMGAHERVTTVPGDYHTAPFPEGNDVVLMSGVLHRETPATCQALISRAWHSLEVRGLLMVADVFTDASGTHPPFATLFGLNMLLTATDGGVHADADVVAWMGQTGFTQIDLRPFPRPMPHTLIVGIKE